MTCTVLEHALAADKSDIRVAIWDGYSWDEEDVRGPDAGYTPLRSLGLIVTSDGWTLGKAEPSTTLTAVPGMAGSADQTIVDARSYAYPGRRTVEINIAALGDAEQIREGMAHAGTFNGATVRVKGLLADPRLYIEGRASLGEWTLRRRAGGALVAAVSKLSIAALPYAYGPLERVELSTGSQTVLVKGNAPTAPFVSLESASGSTAPAQLSYYPNTGAAKVLKSYLSSSAGWSFWCAAHYSKAKADGGDPESPKIGIAMSADWLTLNPGSCSLYCSTSGYLTYNPVYAF